MNFIAKNLKFLRKRDNVKQTELAIQLNKASSSIGNWENGISEPNITEIIFLSKFFDVDITALLESDLENVQLNNETGSEKSEGNVQLKVKRNVQLNKKEPCAECETKDQLIVMKDQLLTSNEKLIKSLEAQIVMLSPKKSGQKTGAGKVAEKQYQSADHH